MVLSEIGRMPVSTRRQTLGRLNVHYALTLLEGFDLVRNRRSELALASSRQGPRSPIGEPLEIRSSCGGLRCPAEGGPVLPQSVQQRGELARERHFRLLGAAPLAEPHG